MFPGFISWGMKLTQHGIAVTIDLLYKYRINHLLESPDHTVHLR